MAGLEVGNDFVGWIQMDREYWDGTQDGFLFQEESVGVYKSE